MKTRLAQALLATGLVLALAACGNDDEVIIGSEQATLTVINDSNFVLSALFLTPAGSPSFGPDRLGGDGLFPGEEITLFDIPCDFYDALLIDEFGVECALLDLDLCFDDTEWFIDDALLARCDAGFATSQSSEP